MQSVTVTMTILGTERGGFWNHLSGIRDLGPVSFWDVFCSMGFDGGFYDDP